MNRKLSSNRTNILSNQLSRQLLSLSIVALLGLLALVMLGLQSSFQTAQFQLTQAKNTAHNTFISFLGGLNDDLYATSDALITTSDAGEILRRTLKRQPAIFELDYINAQGDVLNQRRRVGQAKSAFADQPWLETVKSGETYIGSVDYGEFGVPFVTIALPVTDKSGNFKGTLLSITDLTALWRPIISSKIGETGYIYITDHDGKLLAFRDLKLVQDGMNINSLIGRTPQLIAQSNINLYSGMEGSLSIATGESLEIVPWYIIVEQPVSEALRAFIWLAVILALLLIFVGMQTNSVFRFTRRRITEPLGLLQEGVKELESTGHLVHPIVLDSKDELSNLANTFNSLSAQLGELIGTLEQRVTDRTKALATSTEVSRRLSTILNQKKLVSEVVNQVNDAFGYYHTQIYFFDQANQNLVMAGGTGQAGELMLAQFHKVAKGRGLVGRAAESNEPILVSDTTQNPEWLPNPLLPETKSEVAIPISIGDQVLGVLDVQQNTIDGLKREDVDSLQSIANQIAVALRNIQSTEAIAKRAAELQTVANISTAAATIANVEEMLQQVVHLTQRGFGLYHAHVFVYNDDTAKLEIAACGYKEGDEHEGTHGATAIPLEQEHSLVARAGRTRQAVIVNDVRSDPGWLPNPILTETAAELAVPLIVGDQLLGVLDVQSERINAFTEEDANIQSTLASQIATALQNVRSFTEAQRQAERETTVNLITQKIQNTTSVEAALQIAARELGHALGMKSTLVSLDPSALAGESKAAGNE
jgi:GAF domain-containing protein